MVFVGHCGLIPANQTHTPRAPRSKDAPKAKKTSLLRRKERKNPGVGTDMDAAKADMEAMESAVCFDFCSTIKGMNYFGMTAGRECYCTPYYKQGVEGSGDCDALCEGDSTQFCGNMDGRANIYQMHSCANAEKL